jgi:hypothetical protein
VCTNNKAIYLVYHSEPTVAPIKWHEKAKKGLKKRLKKKKKKKKKRQEIPTVDCRCPT